MHSAKFVVGVARLVRREPCLWKCSRRNSDCCLPIASLFVSGEPLRETKRHGRFVRVFCLVGVARLELAALRSRTVRATKLRYTPLNIISFYLPSFIRCAIFMFGSARFPSGLAFSIQSGNRHRLDVKYFCLRSGLIANQTALHPVGKFDCLCNIHQFANFCNKIAPTI